MRGDRQGEKVDLSGIGLGDVARLQNVLDNPDVVRMNKIYLEEVVALSNKSTPALKVLMILVGKMSEVNSVVISSETLEKIARLSNSSVKRALKILREDEWLDVGKVGTTNIYRINSDIFWHETPDGVFAQFQANVVLNLDEQDEITRKRTPGVMTRNIPMVTAGDYKNEKPQAELF
jgi:hypothetical protein